MKCTSWKMCDEKSSWMLGRLVDGNAPGSTSVIHVETDLLWRRTGRVQKHLYPTYFKICRHGGMSSQIRCPRFGPAPYYRTMETVEDASEEGHYRYQPISRPLFCMRTLFSRWYSVLGHDIYRILGGFEAGIIISPCSF